MYQLFKDFAGPTATIIASFVAVGVTCYFAKLQADIAKEKLRHDLYDKRYLVFDATRKLLCQAGLDGKVSDDHIRAFLIDTGDSVFLFNDELSSYLEEIRLSVQRLQFLNKQLETLCDVDQRTACGNQKSIVFEWLVDQLRDKLVERFKPFLKLDDLAQRSGRKVLPDLAILTPRR